jgi:hypothetical protein
MPAFHEILFPLDVTLPAWRAKRAPTRANQQIGDH